MEENGIEENAIEENGIEENGMEESLRQIAERFPLKEEKIKMYSPLSLAYIGDSVFDLIIRTMITVRGNTQPGKYHERAVHYVSAGSQSRIADRIRPCLTEEEEAVFRRGKNAKPGSFAKNQSHYDYQMATGFEALLGYLYLTGQMDRIFALLDQGLYEEEPCLTKKTQ